MEGRERVVEHRGKEPSRDMSAVGVPRASHRQGGQEARGGEV